MSDDDGVISRSRFKGKKITYASTHRIEEFRQIACEFMEEIFELLPGEYLISDESDVRDFTDFGSSDTSEIWKRIMDVYGFKQSDVGSGHFVNIFAEIARRRNIQ
ncbi:MAG TPA: hypothetical protein VGA88_05365 [Burkholderiales bacterium]